MTADDELAWETVDAETAYECPGFTVEHESVVLPDDTETSFDYLSEPPAVVILPFTSEGEVVVIEEWRHAVKRINRGLPVGSVESTDTDLEAAARRELREETGYTAERVEKLCATEPANGIADSVLHFFVAHGCTQTNGQQLDFNESIRAETTTLEELKTDIRDGELRDGRAVLGVLYHETLGNDEA